MTPSITVQCSGGTVILQFPKGKSRIELTPRNALLLATDLFTEAIHIEVRAAMKGNYKSTGGKHE